ncbi:MAG TPA: hypothetical protein VIN59_08455 [Alphaproteobacteria bacterium]
MRLLGFLLVLMMMPLTAQAKFGEGSTTVFDLKLGCFHSDSMDHETLTQDDPTEAAYCDGYMDAVVSLFHSSQIGDLMSPDQCFDMTSVIPDWYGAIKKSIWEHLESADDKQNALEFIVKSVVTDYPCANVENDTTNPVHGRRTTH